MGFAEAFLDHVRQRPGATFLTQGAETLSFADALKLVRSTDTSLAQDQALNSNSLTSVIAWLATELSRDARSGASKVDFVSTSGSTGKPKRFYVSLESQLITAKAINKTILNQETLDEVIVLPLSHSSARGRLRAAVLRGSAIHLASNPFTFKSLNVDSYQGSAYAMAVTPSTFRYLQQRLGVGFWSHFKNLRNLEFGSAALRESEQNMLLKQSPEDLAIFMHYGLTEASRSFIRNVRNSAWNSLGDPMPHTRYRLSNEGQLLISGPHAASKEIMQHGERNIDEIETGDLCAVSDSGEVLLIGRQKNTINFGGYTLQIEHLESELSKNQALESVAVGKADDPLLGEIPVIFIQSGLRNTVLSAWGSLALVGTFLKEPRVCEISEIPLLSSGKIDRQALNRIASEFVRVLEQ